MTLKTSEEWLNDKSFEGLIILDYDGWNRNPKDWEYSWYQQKITKDEFERRLCQSTIQWRVPKL